MKFFMKPKADRASISMMPPQRQSRWYIEHRNFDFGKLTNILTQEEWPNFPLGPPCQAFT